MGGAITGGDVGAVLFVNPASVLSQDSANFFWDDANKRLGIGNNAPAVSLEVGDATKEEIIRASSGVNGNAILSANSFSSTGNPLTQYVVAGGNNWVTGVDNADSDKYKISFHITDLGTNNFLAIPIPTLPAASTTNAWSGVPSLALNSECLCNVSTIELSAKEVSSAPVVSVS